jgi:hypothetical protein
MECRLDPHLKPLTYARRDVNIMHDRPAHCRADHLRDLKDLHQEAASNPLMNGHQPL